MKPSERIKQIRREAITRTTAKYLELWKDESPEYQAFQKERVERENELAPEFWIHGILEYLDEQANQN